MSRRGGMNVEVGRNIGAYCVIGACFGGGEVGTESSDIGDVSFVMGSPERTSIETHERFLLVVIVVVHFLMQEI